ncbi:hypothetical protein C5167_049157 [Papaver somniferum]|uniref:Uncharacterized protein n=1 Tax=Papaver somniferum TaxID=3469 RepID=A0A4Y7KMW4_PAPSO|nr:hypothetical protein C5167_049157 [Papaver somniferum]
MYELNLLLYQTTPLTEDSQAKKEKNSKTMAGQLTASHFTGLGYSRYSSKVDVQRWLSQIRAVICNNPDR